MPRQLRALYMSPAEMLTLGGTVTGTAAKTTYERRYLTNGLPNYPLRADGGSASWSASGSSQLVNGAAALNTNVTGGGAITVTGLPNITQPARIGGAPSKNGWSADIDGASGELVNTSRSSVSIGASGSPDLIVGEFVYGRFRELPRPVDKMGERGYESGATLPAPSQLGQMPVYPPKKAWRTFSGKSTADAAGIALIEALWDAAEGGSKFFLWVPDPLLNDVWAVVFDGRLNVQKENPDLFHYTLQLREVPRQNWN